MNNARNIEPDLRLKAAQLNVEMGDWVHGLAFGVVPGLDNLPGFVLVGGAEAGAFAGGGVHAIEFVSPNSSTG